MPRIAQATPREGRRLLLVSMKEGRVIMVEWTRHLERRLVLEQMQPEAGELALLSHASRLGAGGPAPQPT
jgi:hypothetical protein